MRKRVAEARKGEVKGGREGGREAGREGGKEHVPSNR
jgi:hypothetical protein